MTGLHVDCGLVIELERSIRVKDALLSLKEEATSPQRPSTIDEALLGLNHRIAELKEVLDD